MSAGNYLSGKPTMTDIIVALLGAGAVIAASILPLFIQRWLPTKDRPRQRNPLDQAARRCLKLFFQAANKTLS